MSMDPTPPLESAALLEQARQKLRRRPRPERHWTALAAAAFFAACAIAFAVAAVLAPPLSHSPAAKSSVQ